MATPIIRLATTTDTDAMAAFAAKSFRDTFGHNYTPEDLQMHLDAKCGADFVRPSIEAGRAWLIEEDDVVVGYATSGPVTLPVDDLRDDDEEIYRFYLAQHTHGTGIAQALMDKVLAQLSHAPRVFLSVWSENPRAQAFYARNGFTKLKEYTYYVGTHPDVEWVVVRER